MAQKKDSLLSTVLLIGGGLAAYSMLRKKSSPKKLKGKVIVDKPLQKITEREYNTAIRYPVQQPTTIRDKFNDLNSGLQNFFDVLRANKRPKELTTKVDTVRAEMTPGTTHIDPTRGLVPGIGRIHFKLPPIDFILKNWKRKRYLIRNNRVYVQMGKRFVLIPNMQPTQLQPDMTIVTQP
jgi:hypothetical protein